MKYILLALISTMMTSYASGQKKTTASPDAPEEGYADNKEVERLISTLSVPVSIELNDIERQLNNSFKGLIYEDDSYSNNNGDNLKMKVWKNGDIKFTAVRNDIFDYSVPLKVWANYQVNVFGIKQDKSTTFEMNLRFSSKFFIASTWQMQTQTTPKGFDFVSEPKVSFSSITVPITPIISKIISNNHTMFARLIDKSVNDNMSIKPYVLDAWNSVRTPYLVSEEYQTWMQITPLAILMEPLKSDGRIIRSKIGFRAYTETTTGITPTKPEPVQDIPNLKYTKDIPEEFQVSLKSTISYAEAAKIAKKMFVGETYKFKNDKYEINITEMEVYGSQEKMVIELTTKGDLNGIIYLEGVPFYNPVSNAIQLANTELNLKTRNVLIKMASWILEGTLEKKIQQEFTIPLAETIASTKKSIEESFSTEWMKGVKTTCRISTIQPEKVTLTPDGISTMVKATGSVNLNVSGL
jgi:hypothetical protein